MPRWMFLPLATLVSCALQGQGSLPEGKIVAKMFRIILGYVTWPAVGTAPLKIVIIGGLDLADDFDEAFAERTVGGRKVVLKYLSTAAFLGDKDDYDVVFINQGEQERASLILAKTKGKPVLTFGRGEGFAKVGVMVNLIRDGARIRFEVNADKFKDANLGINSRVLQMGTQKGG